MYIFITAAEWGRSRLRTFGLGGINYYADWTAQTYGYEVDIYPSWWAS
jgi:hypothetical protein